MEFNDGEKRHHNTKSVILDTFYEIMFFAREEKEGIPMKIAEPNLLTLDYWRDEVSYSIF